MNPYTRNNYRYTATINGVRLYKTSSRNLTYAWAVLNADGAILKSWFAGSMDLAGKAARKHNATGELRIEVAKCHVTRKR